ncbi:Organic hydroperoxide resistance protein [Limosilactobacillus gastricus PS3]|uniref:Organic hydroperoxide resistance protein n=1 Tax=Limosilactobacillus gastricus PS3 TaxID=1144300 RepID=H4GIA7_9LACO|nr:OsmC family protein [Limosilactobacillus gastricus]EHS87328.1 Organic hydroperoxide resistance protein [Limosilactobacillus gastricus PS3]
MDFKSIYQTTVENDMGILGETKGDLVLRTSSPLSEMPGTNPEQLVGLAYATCLNATIEAEEARRDLVHNSQVRVQVDLGKDVEGYQFKLLVLVRIPEVNRTVAEEILEIAKRRCPMEKLLGQHPNVTVKLVDQFKSRREN